MAFQHFPQRFNLYTDSKYIVSLFPTIETALITGTTKIKKQLSNMQHLIHKKKEKFFIGHIRGHMSLPGPLTYGNYMADYFTRPVQINNVLEAKQNNALHHQNANALRYQFKITRKQARQIVKNCNTCPPARQVQKMGVNPRGLKPGHLWQMDVTHCPQFEKLCFIHVCVDTYSHAITASARTGEAVKDVLQHLIMSFNLLEKPIKIKTDNGPAYCSKAFKQYCKTWGILHVTGIPHNPQGQAIIERAHQDLKGQIHKLRKAHKYFSPHHLLSHALFTLNREC